MKKSKIFIIICSLVLFASCSSVNYWKIKMDIPRITSVSLDQHKEIVITNFLVEKETKDLNLNQELTDYLASEIGARFKGKINSKKISWEEKDILKNKEYWKNLSTESEEAIFLTGDAQYTQETRKAILDKRSTRSREILLSPDKGLAQRRFFTLVLNLYLIKADTGEIFYERNFKESKGYENPKQTANFAFFDLIERVSVKFIRNVLSDERVQQRYLITD